MHVAVLGQRAQHIQVGGRQPGKPEERKALGKAGEVRLGAQPVACRLEKLGGGRPVRSGRAAVARAPAARSSPAAARARLRRRPAFSAHARSISGRWSA